MDDGDLWQRATLGIATVSNDGQFADQVLAKAVDFIRQQRDIELIDYQKEIK